MAPRAKGLAGAGEAVSTSARLLFHISHQDLAFELGPAMAERPALSLSLAKQALDAGLDSTVDGAMAREVEHALLTSLSGENDAPREGFNRG